MGTLLLAIWRRMRSMSRRSVVAMAGATFAAPVPIVPLQADTKLPIEFSHLQRPLSDDLYPALAGRQNRRGRPRQYSIRGREPSSRDELNLFSTT